MSSITLEESQDRSEANKPQLTVEELIKAMRCCSRPNGDACNNCPDDKYKSCTSVMAQVADALESLAAERDGYREQLSAVLAENTRLAEKVPHWINVKDRLPEDGMDIIVANASTGTEYVSHRDLIFFNESKDAFVPTSYFQEFKFTHWMPLPQPPKEENNA